MTNLPDVALHILNIARKLGCNAQVTMMESHSMDINLRKGEIEKLLTSVAVSTGVWLFKDKKSSIISFSGEDFDHMEDKLALGLEDLQYLNEDPYKRLLSPTEFAGAPPDLDLADQAFHELDIPTLTQTLALIEKKALDFSNKIIPSEMADFSGSYSTIHIYTTAGLQKSFKRSLYDFSYAAVAQEKKLKEQDYWFERKRHFNQLPPQNEIGKIGEIAAQRALRRLGGKKITSGEYKVIFSQRTAASILDLLGDALDGEEVMLKNSFLVDRLGEKLFPGLITIIDDPAIPRYPGSYPFDGEGINAKTKTIIENGHLATYLHNSYSAGKLNMPLTGNASRPITSVPHVTIGNFYLQGGQGTLDDLVHEMKDGLWVDDLYVSGHNSVTGDFSFGCTGFLVQKGKIAYPVKEITIAGNILELFQNIVAVADDNLWQSSLTSPSFMVSKLAVAGI